MTFEDTTCYDIYNLSDLDDLSCNFSDQTESGLCVPLDPIESLSWLPTFPNKPISFHDLDLPKHDNLLFDDVGFFSSFQSNEIKKRPSLEDLWPCADLGFAKKKQRTKRSSKQRRFLPSFVEESGLVGDGDADGDGDRQRRCSHCQTDKTPQWRIGPLGPKTLCNACGVRYKSGRLVPEYRPAASPTFDNFKHSNFHKKIAKIRRADHGPLLFETRNY